MSPSGFAPTGARRTGGSGDLRQGNLTQILRYVRDHGASSRHDIARGCGLGISTMTDLVGELRTRRLVKELDPIRRPGAGRPTRPIALDGDPWCVLGVHIELDRITFLGIHGGGPGAVARRGGPPTSAPAPARTATPPVDAALRQQLERIPDSMTLVGAGGRAAGLRDDRRRHDRLGGGLRVDRRSRWAAGSARPCWTRGSAAPTSGWTPSATWPHCTPPDWSSTCLRTASRPTWAASATSPAG